LNYSAAGGGRLKTKRQPFSEEQMQNVIETKNLTKMFGKFKAVDDIALSVRKGEIYGFLGLNGAGKTTTIRMLLGMIRPSKGESYLNGTRVHAGNNKLWNSIGYLVEIPYSYPELTVKENLEIARRLRFIPDCKAVDSVMDILSISQYKDRLAKNLSLGNAQRLGLAKAIIHNPEVLILDEPANGLDPAGIVEIRELLHSLAQNQGVTIFISSHILGEISKFATRIGIIHKGKLLQEINTDELENFRRKKLLIQVQDKDGASAALSNKGITSTIIENGILQIIDKEAIKHPETINETLVNLKYPPSMVKVDKEDLETYFLRVIENDRGAK
jgi:ABC-2 type transport system ATP-binding protein